MDASGPPPLTVVIPARDGLAEVAEPLAALHEQARATGTELLVVGGRPAGPGRLPELVA